MKMLSLKPKPKGPPEFAVDEIRALGEQNPLNPRETLIGNVGVIVTSFDGFLLLEHIRSFEPGAGHASIVLKKIAEIADKNGVRMKIDVVPTSRLPELGTGKKALTKSQLFKWYARHGFERQTFGDGALSDEMIREPRARNPSPSQTYTLDYVKNRKKDNLPSVLFHFTRWDRALKISETGQLLGRPRVSMTENPALAGPGPFVIIFRPEDILKCGFSLWPYLEQDSYRREAEWAVASGDAELLDTHILSDKVVINLAFCAYAVGWVGQIREPKAIVNFSKIGINGLRMFKDFDWTEWWDEKRGLPKMAEG